MPPKPKILTKPAKAQPRSRPVPAKSIGEAFVRSAEYKAIGRLAVQLAEIRNTVQVVYSDRDSPQANGIDYERKTVTVTDAGVTPAGTAGTNPARTRFPTDSTWSFISPRSRPLSSNSKRRYSLKSSSSKPNS